MKFLKRLVGTFLCLCLMVLSFGGCDLWTLNSNKYLNQVVASYGDITVTLEEVYNAYYNYGNYYYDSQGDATFAGIKSTATQLLNKKIVVEYLENGTGKITLTQNQLNDVWETVYSNINSSVTSIESDLLKADDLSLPSTDADSTDTSDEEDYEKEYATYDKTYIYENGQLTKIAETVEPVETYSEDIYQFTSEDMAGYSSLDEKLNSMETNTKATIAYDNFRSTWWNGKGHTTTNDDGELYSELAWSKYISNLKTAESGKNLSTKSEEIFYRELLEQYQSAYENELLTVFQDNFNATDTINESLVLSTYTSLAQAQKETNSTTSLDSDGNITYSNYVSAMKSRSDPVMYTVTSGDWFQVSHILLKFSDDDVTALTNLKTKLENDAITETEYNTAVTNIKGNVTVTDRETGNEILATKVLSNLQTALDGKTAEEKIQIFNEYIYRYNMDDGANNADYAYYIPTDEANDSMVTPFANESRILRTEGVGSISDLIEINEVDGYVDNDGETQTPTYSGYHIIMYLGEIQTLPTDGTVTMQQLNDYILNPLNNNDTNSKTMLDYVIGKISFSHYSDYEQSLLNSLESEYEIQYDNSIINELLSKFS